MLIYNNIVSHDLNTSSPAENVTQQLSNLKKPAFRLDVARNHFCNRVVSLWNGLPEHVVTAASLTVFKNYLSTIDFSSYIKFDRNL